jgi:hypothetical protein
MFNCPNCGDTMQIVSQREIPHGCSTEPLHYCSNCDLTVFVGMYSGPIWAMHLNQPTNNGIHTIGFYTSQSEARANLRRHNRENPNAKAHIWDYPANRLLTNDASADYFPPEPD